MSTPIVTQVKSKRKKTKSEFTEDGRKKVKDVSIATDSEWYDYIPDNIREWLSTQFSCVVDGNKHRYLFLTTDIPKVISASLNDYARSGTLNTSTIAFSGSFSGAGYSFATASNGTIVLTTTVPGTYTVYYTIGAYLDGTGI